MNAVIAVAIVTSPLWLMLPIAALGTHTPTGRRITEVLEARMARGTR